MAKVCVITGGGSGMGLETAKFMKDKVVVLSGRTVKKLMKRANLAKSDYNKAGFAYALSKNFVVWYAQKSAYELGYAIATVADERNGYLAGVDVLCDGGATNGKNFLK